MKKKTLLPFFVLLANTSFCQNIVSSYKGFDLLNDFMINRSVFNESILDWDNPDGNYGYLWRSTKRDYIVYELFQFQNKAEIHLLYVLDNTLKCRIARRIGNSYDKEWKDLTKKLNKTEEYYLFDSASFKRLDNKLNIINSSKNDSIKNEVLSLLKLAMQSK